MQIYIYVKTTKEYLQDKLSGFNVTFFNIIYYITQTYFSFIK